MELTPTPLPPTWQVRVSRSKGKVYYYHTRSNKTQWSRPTTEEIAAADAAVSAQESNLSIETDAQESEAVDRKRQKLDLSTSSNEACCTRWWWPPCAWEEAP